MRGRITWGGALFGVVLAAYLVCANGVWLTDHTISFMQLDYALYSSHSVALVSVGGELPHSVDDFVRNGQTYSALAPGAAFLALPFVGAAFAVSGGYDPFGLPLLASEAFVALAGALASYFVYRLAALYFRRSTSLFIAFAFAFSTIAWPFATYFFQSDVTAMLLVLAAFFAVKARRSQGSGGWFALAAGAAAGLAFTTDYVEGVAVPILIAFLLIAKRRSLGSMARSAGGLLLGALPGFALIGAYNYAIFGNPLTMTEQAYMGTGSVFASFTTPVPFGVALDLFSQARGLFIFVPIAVLGVLGCVGAVTRGRARLEVLMFVALFAGILIPYSAWYDPAGGVSFGPRFLLAAIPFLLVPGGYAFDQARGVGKPATAAVYAVYAAGAAMNGAAALVKVIPPITPFNVSPFLKYTLPSFLSGNFDTYWPGSLAAGVAVIFSLGIAIPILLVESARRREGHEVRAENPLPS